MTKTATTIYALEVNGLSFPNELWSFQFSFAAKDLADAKTKAFRWARRTGDIGNTRVRLASGEFELNNRFDEWVR